MKEVAFAKKKNRTEKAQRRFEKEKEIGRRVQAGESRSDMEAELELEDPTEMGGDASTSEDEGHRGVIMTLVEHHEPMTASISGGWDTEKHDDVPASRKHTMSEDTTVEQEVKRARSPCPSKASLAPYPPALSVAEHAGQSDERAHAPASLGSACVRDPQWGDAPSIALVGAP